MRLKIFFVLCCFVLLSETTKAEELRVVTIKKDTLDLLEYAKDKNLFVILFSWGYSCFDCFRDIVNSLDSLHKKDTNIKYVFLCRSDNSSLARRNTIETIDKIKTNQVVFFDIDDTIFGRYKIDITPAVINIKDSKVSYISFDSFRKQKFNYQKVLNR